MQALNKTIAMGVVALLATTALGARPQTARGGGERGLADAGFERPGHPDWMAQGVVAPSAEGYTGGGALVLGADGPSAILQVLEPSRAVGAALAAPAVGAWLFAEQAGAVVRVEWRGPGAGALVSTARVVPRAARWTWTVFEGVSSAPAGRIAGFGGLAGDGGGSLWIGADGPVRVDDVQLGARAAVTGGPERHATCNFVGWYRSPLFGGGSTSPSAPSEIWRNWYWTQPPACAPGSSAFAHDPECATSSSCLRSNGRRDVAVGTEDGEDELPLFGAYDSRDPVLLETQVKLAEAIGFDSFVYLYHGDTLAQQEVLQGREPLNAETYAALLDVCDGPKRSLKVAVMYEPKVHFNGWVSGEPSKAAKLAGIQHDLEHLVTTYGGRKSVLRHDGELVVFVFRNDVCDAGGTQCLNDADWLALAAGVELSTGEALFLVADVPPGPTSAFGGLSRWHLVALELLRYGTFQAALASVSSTPQPALSALQSHADTINAVATTWAAAKPGRVAVALAWPGFDDSGVAGWGGGNFTGANGQPVCVRVASDFGGEFFSTTLDSALASGADWLQVATWNDWNERTGIEPRWRDAYVQSVLAGVVPKRSDFEEVFERAIEAQAAVAAFKGLPYGPGLQTKLHRSAAKYLLRAASDPGVAQYD